MNIDIGDSVGRGYIVLAYNPNDGTSDYIIVVDKQYAESWYRQFVEDGYASVSIREVSEIILSNDLTGVNI